MEDYTFSGRLHAFGVTKSIFLSNIINKMTLILFCIELLGLAVWSSLLTLTPWGDRALPFFLYAIIVSLIGQLGVYFYRIYSESVALGLSYACLNYRISEDAVYVEVTSPEIKNTILAPWEEAEEIFLSKKLVKLKLKTGSKIPIYLDLIESDQQRQLVIDFCSLKASEFALRQINLLL